MSSILTQSSRVVLDACLSRGKWGEPKMGCWNCRLVRRGRRGQEAEKMLEALCWASGTGKPCCEVQPSLRLSERKAARIRPSDGLAACLERGRALPWKGTCSLSIFLLQTCHSITGEPQSCSLTASFCSVSMSHWARRVYEQLFDHFHCRNQLDKYLRFTSLQSASEKPD